MCTRVLWNTNDLAVLSGRTMDWPESTEPQLVAFPRGRERDGSLVKGKKLVDGEALRWTSTYGSLVTTIYGFGTIDGVNERGLAAHALYLQATELAPRDPAQPALHAGLWAQYLLDQAATVEEALGLLDTYQLVMVAAHGFDATIHLAIEDASGDSAIIEYSGGEPVVHHGREFTLMTNDPAYDEQLALLAGQDFSQPSSDMPLPGNVNARDRFQRAAYYSALLPEPRSEREAAASVLAVMRNVSVPFGAPYRDFGIYNTEYRTVADLTHRHYFFELTTSPNVTWTALDELDLRPGAPTLALDPHDIALSGDVSERYVPTEIGF
ncbi:MAG: linear amide C-N hydrolase [Patulibacter sp.]|nr:linear amide C-N hydrolase [Patulibacter sp.]